MQQLGNTLKAMRSSADMPREQPRGSTMIASTTSPSSQLMASLRLVASQMDRDLMPDESLRALLLQHFGPARLSIKEKVRHVYSDSEYACVSDGFDISLDGMSGGEMPIFEAVEHFNKPADRNFVARHVGMMRVSLARRQESEEDLTLLIGVYADILEGFPRDIVAHVTKQWIAEKKWFPLASELREACEALVIFRKTVMKTFEQARSNLMTGQTKKIAADPRLGVHWKVLPKKQWMAQHYEWALAECEDILRLARQNPTSMDIKSWEAEVAKRKADLAAANGVTVNETFTPATPAAENAKNSPATA